MIHKRFQRSLGGAALAGAVLALASCGGGGSSGSGSLSLGITDGPVEDADNVWVQFSSVTLKPAEGEPFTIELDPVQRVDLLAQQNGKSKLLLENETVPAGRYNWIRLGVDLDEIGDTVIVIGGTPHKLDCPSCAQTGLKLVSGFTVGSGGTVDLTIDFDLRKSVIEAPPRSDKYKLKPALRLVNNANTGEIAVTILADHAVSVCDPDVEPFAAYVFMGAGVTPDDIDTTDPGDVDPVTTVSLTQEIGSDSYTGTAGFLPAGDYTVALACNPEDDEAEDDDNLVFRGAQDVEVEAGETATYKLP